MEQILSDILKKYNPDSQYIDSDGQVLDVITNPSGSKIYMNAQGRYHRLDGPAREYCDGTEIWYKNGKWH